MALNILMVGTGEYTTGFVGHGASTSDKRIGVVALTLFDLRRRGKVGKLSMVGTNGQRFPAIRDHLQKNISAAYNSLDVSFASFPSDSTARDPDAYKAAIDALAPGDAITVFTPDTTHASIAEYAIRRGIHVLITKPATKLLKDHQHLLLQAREHNVFVFIEHHKRFDPAYSDARARARTMGEFNYFYSYMSQPKYLSNMYSGNFSSPVWAIRLEHHILQLNGYEEYDFVSKIDNSKSQLETFKAWAGKDSDISYYLNSHHIDICESMVPGWRPIAVSASGSKGTAEALGCSSGTEDTISLLVEWQKQEDPARTATGVYTASWTAPQKAGVHSNQYFHSKHRGDMASKGEIRIDQAKRGYEIGSDEALQWVNPFYMRYAPDEDGNFAGQTGYGYYSFERFCDAVTALKGGHETLDSLDEKGLPTLKNTIATTAILEAGRRSLDEARRVLIENTNGHWKIV